MDANRSPQLKTGPRDGGSSKSSTGRRSRNKVSEEVEGVAEADAATTMASVSMASTSTTKGGDPQEQTDSDIRPESVFEATLGFHQMELDDELILVDVLRNNSLRLNATATYIWRLIQQRTPLNEVSNRVSQDFGLPPDRAYEVVSSFARDLTQTGIASPAQQTAHGQE